MAQHALAMRHVARLIVAIGTILALMLAGGAPSEHVNEFVSFIQLFWQ